MPSILALAAGGSIDINRSITRVYSLEQASEAYLALDRGEIIGRAIIDMSL